MPQNNLWFIITSEEINEIQQKMHATHEIAPIDAREIIDILDKVRNRLVE